MAELPYFGRFKEADTQRTLATVSAQHAVDFAGFVGECLQRDGSVSVLDIGSGNSGFCTELAALYPDGEFFQVDPCSDSERNFDSALRPKNVHFVQGDGNQLPFRDDQFDLITTTWAACAYSPANFVELPTSYVTEIARVLKPAGFASVKPEVSWFSYMPLERIVEECGFNLPRVCRIARDYRQIIAEGTRVHFMDEPNRARMYGEALDRTTL